MQILETGEFNISLQSPQEALKASIEQLGCFENTLLHLAAGAEGTDPSVLEYCITSLQIDIDARNADGLTPLLLACCAGRESKNLALLELGADVNLDYYGGETPLHWLGVLKDPRKVLDQFVLRHANIEAQVTHARIIPNFLGSSLLQSSPLVWAMAMGNVPYVTALLEHGADINLPGPSGDTPLWYACRPQGCSFFDQFSKQPSFKITRDLIDCSVLVRLICAASNRVEVRSSVISRSCNAGWEIESTSSSGSVAFIPYLLKIASISSWRSLIDSKYFTTRCCLSINSARSSRHC